MSETVSLVKRRALGRGLGALIPQGTATTPPPADRRVLIAEIRPNPNQPRRYFDDVRLTELAESIKQQGILQPLIVRKVEPGYELIIGERRLRAAQKAGLDRVPVIVKEVTDAQSMEMALVENIQREELTPIEEALAYRQLMEELHLTQEEVATRVGKSRPVITNLLRVLNLPDEIKEEIDRGGLSVGHARTLVSLGTPEQQIAIARRIMRQGLSVRETETLVSQAVSQPSTEALPPPTASGSTGEQTTAHDIHVSALEEELMRTFGTKVRLRPKKKGGRIEIEYYSNEELEGILARLRR
ncbi:MAG: ParB/RepB/Spo0J family partition protein [Deltaproteobacteria bacterium]|nr:ParB/RepB/Spo0J family partition protein [Deltaproteobacteria bacterium]